MSRRKLSSTCSSLRPWLTSEYEMMRAAGGAPRITLRKRRSRSPSRSGSMAHCMRLASAHAFAPKFTTQFGCRSGPPLDDG
eukprot:4255046-Pyramimonas_sp.AAC.1